MRQLEGERVGERDEVSEEVLGTLALPRSPFKRRPRSLRKEAQSNQKPIARAFEGGKGE